MNKNQKLINLFFEANNERLEKSILALIRQNSKKPKDLYEQYITSINQVIKYSIIKRG